MGHAIENFSPWVAMIGFVICRASLLRNATAIKQSSTLD